MDKRTALTKLRQSRFLYEQGLERQEAERRTRLHRFLDQHQQARQWALSLAALKDAVRHGVMPNDAALCRAMSQCGQRGQLQAAKHIYVELYRQIKRPRPLEAHVAFMAACADAGDFAEAHRQFCALRERDVKQHGRNSGHRPIVNDDLTTEYLRAAMCASLAADSGRGSRSYASPTGAAAIPAAPLEDSSTSTPSRADESVELQTRPLTGTGHKEGHPDAAGRLRSNTLSAVPPQSEGSQGSSLPWELALENFMMLRKDTTFFRKHNELTPLLLENAAQLACLGRQWQLCLAMIRAAQGEQALVPPEAYDAAIRACYGAQKHTHVVHLMEQLIATRVAPDERSVRLALTSSEEVSAQQRALQTVSSALSTGKSHPVGSTPAWSMALTLFHALERNGFPLYQQSYEAPLRSCVNAGRWKEALKMLDAMQRDHRPVSAPLYAQVLRARIEAADTWPEIERLLRTSALSDDHTSVVVLYLAALRACMRLGDWGHFHLLHREMRDRDIPETYDKMRILIEAAFMQEKYHSVLMRFARFENVTQYERRRVTKDQLVQFYEEDFELPPALLDMVLTAYEKIKDPKDPMVEGAYQAALRHKESRNASQSITGCHTAPDDWMFSQTARETRSPPEFF